MSEPLIWVILVAAETIAGCAFYWLAARGLLNWLQHKRFPAPALLPSAEGLALLFVAGTLSLVLALLTILRCLIRKGG